MGLSNQLAQYKAWRRGVVHATLNPKGPGAVRIHLVPPKWRPMRSRPYVVILNGYYVLPLGYSWAILLENFILEIDKHDGQPVDEDMVNEVVVTAVEHTHKTYYDIHRWELARDLGEMLDILFDVAAGREPKSGVGAMSLREYAPNMTAPHRMDLMISAMTDESGSWNCNLKCRNCYAAGQPAGKALELTTAQWKEIIDHCREAGIPQLTFTGGEPTLRHDLVELIAYSQWFVTRLNTNGVLLTKELCEALRAASLDSVQITLYSWDPEVHNELVGAGLSGVTGSWDKTVAGLRNALAAGLDVSVNTPLCRENADYIKTLAFLKSEGVCFVSSSGLIETGGAKGNLDARLSREEITEILRQGAAFSAAMGLELSFTSPGQMEPEDLREMGLSVPMCGACLSNMAVAPDGTVVPCQSWLGEGYALGNLLRDKWPHIWHSRLCKKIRGMDEGEALLCPLRAGKYTEEVSR